MKKNRLLAIIVFCVLSISSICKASPSTIAGLQLISSPALHTVEILTPSDPDCPNLLQGIDTILLQVQTPVNLEYAPSMDYLHGIAYGKVTQLKETDAAAILSAKLGSLLREKGVWAPTVVRTLALYRKAGLVVIPLTGLSPPRISH